MPTYWNFRKILDVHPESDYRCVAINADKKTRCGIGGNFMNSEYLTKAATLLDTMDRIESLTECRGHLYNLAYLMMCGSPHRKMENIQEDRCRRWNRTISAYIASNVQDETRKSHAKVLDTERKQRIPSNLGNEECAKILPVNTGSSTPQLDMKALEEVISLTSKSVEPLMTMGDPFTSNDGMTRRFQLQVEEVKDEKLDPSTVYAASNKKICRTLASKKAGDGQAFTKTPTGTAMNVYALPTPPNSTLVPHAPKAHRSPHAQSLLETPTKVPKLTNDAQLELHISDASGRAVNDTNKGTKPMVKFGNAELASTRQAFNFNYVSQAPALQSSFDTESKSAIVAKCIPKESIAKFINFELPAGAAATPRDLPSSSRAAFQDNPNADIESAGMTSVSETNLSTSSTSKLASDVALDVALKSRTTISETLFKTTVMAFTKSLGHSPLPGVGGNGSRSVQQTELPSTPRPLGNQNVSNQDPTILRTRPTTEPVNSKSPQVALTQTPLPMLEITSSSRHQDFLSSSETSNEAPLADFTFVLDFSSGTENRTGLEPKPMALSPDEQAFVNSVVKSSVLEFGPNSKIPSKSIRPKSIPAKSFDFSKWAQASLEARESEICSQLTLSSENISRIESKQEDDGDKETEMRAALRRNDNVKQHSMEERATEKLALSSQENPATNNDGTKSNPISYQTPTKISCGQFEGLMTPADTPERLGADYKSGPEAVEASSSRLVKKPVDLHDHGVVGLSTPKSTPQPLPRPGSLSANEPVSFSPLERAESFSHVLIDSTDRRYKTRIRESQWRTMAQSAEVTQVFDDEAALDEVNIKPFTTPSRSEDLVGEQLNWEKVRATPKRGEGCRWMQGLPQHMKEAYESAFEAARRQFDMLSKLICCGIEEGQ